jgi:UDP-GlcNAc:undecaprenyl-phosphate/decaprenyl-phosphate GlcNAc-1-phosphate transferase
MTTGLLTFAIALVTSLAITFPVRQFAVRVGMMDRPGSRKIHLQPIPLLGGIAIYAAILVAFFISYRGQAFSQILGILAGATLLLLVGTLDDRGLLHHQLKLFIAMPFAGLIVLASGIRTQFFSITLPGPLGSLADSAVTVFWITGITAAFSILDYMDGVCAGIAAIASLFLGILAVLNSRESLPITLAAAIFGAALGFLKWNFTPAKIFMGDGGAMLLGFLIAALALTVHVSAVSPSAARLAPILVLGVPIFDTSLVSFSRLRRGLLPFASPGKDHTGHRLATGLGTRASVLIMYAMAVACGSLAILCTRLNSPWLSIFAATILLAFAGAVVLLESLPFERQGSSSS